MMGHAEGLLDLIGQQHSFIVALQAEVGALRAENAELVAQATQAAEKTVEGEQPTPPDVV